MGRHEQREVGVLLPNDDYIYLSPVTNPYSNVFPER
jgi:hypothetical protein